MSKKIFYGLIVLITTSAYANVNYLGAVSAGSGNSGRASVEASESPFINAATLAHINGYYFSTGLARKPKERQFSVSVIDNTKETIIPSSISYLDSKTDLTEELAVSNRRFQVSVGKMAFKNISFGGAWIYSQSLLDDNSYITNGLQLSTLWTPTVNLGFALIFDNYPLEQPSVKDPYQMRSTTGIATSYNFKDFARFKLDIVTDSNNSIRRPSLFGGVEHYLNKWIIFRAGYGRETELSKTIGSAGIGFILPKFGLHYAFQTINTTATEQRHSIDLAIPVW